MSSDNTEQPPTIQHGVKSEPQELPPFGPMPGAAVYQPLLYPPIGGGYMAPAYPSMYPPMYPPVYPPIYPPMVKSEPIQQPLIPAPSVKPEPTQPKLESTKPVVNPPVLPRELYTTYRSVDQVNYTPERALAEGVNMAKTLESYLNQLDLGTDLRKNVWLRDIESLKRQGSPHTMIAVCGATGAGKSSLLNAVLDDNIVPTSGMRACTAVVTEIGYHDKDTIVAEVEFLALAEWKAELEILLDDLVEEDGHLKRLSDLRSDAGVAWHKMHAVYPLLSAERMVRMTPDEIINSNPRVARILGTTEVIESPNSTRFGQAIAKFIDSKDQKRGRDKQNKEKSKPGEPALWPLIRLVRVRAKAHALSSGAVLVDLPGVADANLARSSIAKDYMKKCDCVWITAPITRAVDDKTAKDLLGEAFRTQLMNGNYDASVITFIATKTDDLSCTEVVGALGLDDNPELVEIEAELDAALLEVDQWTATSKSVVEEMREVNDQIKDLRPIIDEYKDHLKAVKAGKPFEPILTAFEGSVGSPSKKRKRGSGDRRAKRVRLGIDDGDDEDDDEDSDADADGSMDLDYDDFDSNNGGDTEAEDAVEDVIKMRSVIEIDSDGDEVIVLTDSDDDEQVTKQASSSPSSKGGVVTEASLKQLIEKNEAKMKELRAKLLELKKTRTEADAKVGTHKKTASKLQKAKNAFCSKKRNEYSKDVLKEDFRQGLKQLDQADEEAKNPDTFDPAKELRDYNAIDLPVFTCSSRDYIRIKKQVKGDGGPTCFTEPEDTEIPALQGWCHELTVSARERSARSLLNNIVTFLHSMRSFVDKMQGGDTSGRAALAETWASSARRAGPTHTLGLTQAQINPPPAPVYQPAPLYGRRGHRYNAIPPAPDNSLNGLAQRAKRLLEQEQADRKGFSALLRQNMRKVANDCIVQLERAFRDGIQERCNAGANKASQAAVETSDNFAQRMHWQSYRAALRRLGEWRGDLNAELVGPMSREIAASWARLFDSDLFAPTARAGITEIVRLLQQVEASAPADLKDRCRAQSQVALKEAQVLIGNILQNLKSAMTEEQKNISRCLTPHVQSQLTAAYQAAMEERGTGSVARQKALFHNFVDKWRKTIFSGATTTLFTKLNEAAKLIGVLLEEAFYELTDKVEVTISVLWDIPNDNKEEVAKRREVVKRIEAMLNQLKLWIAASKGASHGDVDVGHEYDSEEDDGHFGEYGADAIGNIAGGESTNGNGLDEEEEDEDEDEDENEEEQGEEDGVDEDDDDEDPYAEESDGEGLGGCAYARDLYRRRQYGYGRGYDYDSDGYDSDGNPYDDGFY